MSPAASHHRFSIGAFGCTVVTDGTSLLGGTGALSWVNASDEEVAQAMRGCSGRAEISFNCLVIDSGPRRLLVDAGSGAGRRENAGQLLESLAAAGIEPGSIDMAVLTHCHGDHASGLIDDDGRPVFPNARVVLSRNEWDWWTAPPGAGEAPDARQPVRGQLRSLEARVDRIPAGDQIVPGITTIAATGHTAGQLALLVESGGEQLLCVADAVHHPIQLAHPDWYFPFDYAPEQTVATRRRLFDLAARRQTLVLVYHFPFPGLGHIRPEGDHWRWEPLPAGRAAGHN